MDIVVSVKNLRKTFELNRKEKKQLNINKKIAVDDISFEVEKGTIFALLGPNGAGKTTTLRMLSTLVKPDSGIIEINGLIKKEEIRKHITFLSTDLSLDKNFTPDYLFDYFSGLYKIKNNPLKEELFKLFGIEEFKHKKIGELSTGMKQKTAIAISLLNDPDILIFDEPTNGLDLVLSKEIIDYLLELKKKGKTIIISTHILDVVNKLADKLAIINDGKIKYMGSIEELLIETNKNNLEDAFFEKLEV